MSHSKIAKLVAEVSKELQIDIPEVDKLTIMQEVRNMVKTNHPIPELMNSDSETEQESSSDVEFIDVTDEVKENFMDNITEIQSDEQSNDSVSVSKSVSPLESNEGTKTSETEYEEIVVDTPMAIEPDVNDDDFENPSKLHESKWRDLRRKFSRKNPWVTKRRKKKKSASASSGLKDRKKLIPIAEGSEVPKSVVMFKKTSNRKRPWKLQTVLPKTENEKKSDKKAVLKCLGLTGGPDTRSFTQALASLDGHFTTKLGIGSKINVKDEGTQVFSTAKTKRTEDIIKKSMEKYPGITLKDVKIRLKDCISDNFRGRLKILSEKGFIDEELQEECQNSLFFKCGIARKERFAVNWDKTQVTPRPIQIGPNVCADELRMDTLIGLSGKKAACEKIKYELDLIGTENLSQKYRGVNPETSLSQGFQGTLSNEREFDDDGGNQFKRPEKLIRKCPGEQCDCSFKPSFGQPDVDWPADIKLSTNTQTDKEVDLETTSDDKEIDGISSEKQPILDPVTGHFIFEGMGKVKNEPSDDFHIEQNINEEPENTVDNMASHINSEKDSESGNKDRPRIESLSVGKLSGAPLAELIYSGISAKGVLPIEQIESAINKDIRARRGSEDLNWKQLKLTLAERVSRIEKLMGTISAENKDGEIDHFKHYALQKARAELDSVKEQTGLTAKPSKYAGDKSFASPSVESTDEEASSDSNFSVPNLINNEEVDLEKAEEKGLKRKWKNINESSKRFSFGSQRGDFKQSLDVVMVKEEVSSEAITIDSDSEKESDNLSDIDPSEVPIQKLSKCVRDVKFLDKFDMLIRRELYKTMLAPNSKYDEFDKAMPTIMGLKNEADIPSVLQNKMARLKAKVRKTWLEYILGDCFGKKHTDLINKSRLQAASLEYLRGRIHDHLKPCISKDHTYQMLCRMILVILDNILEKDKFRIIELNQQELYLIREEESAQRKKVLQSEYVNLQLKEAEKLRKVNLLETKIAKLTKALRPRVVEKSPSPREMLIPKSTPVNIIINEVPVVGTKVFRPALGVQAEARSPATIPSIMPVPLMLTRVGPPGDSGILKPASQSVMMVRPPEDKSRIKARVQQLISDEINKAKRLESDVSSSPGVGNRRDTAKGRGRKRNFSKPAWKDRYTNPLGQDMSKIRSKNSPEHIIYPPRTDVQKRCPLLFFKLQEHVQNSLAESTAHLLSKDARQNLAYRIAASYASEHQAELEFVECAKHSQTHTHMKESLDFIIEENIDDDDNDESQNTPPCLKEVKQSVSPLPNHNLSHSQSAADTNIDGVMIKQEPLEQEVSVSKATVASSVPCIKDFVTPQPATAHCIPADALKLTSSSAPGALGTLMKFKDSVGDEFKQNCSSQKISRADSATINNAAAVTSFQRSHSSRLEPQAMPVFAPTVISQKSFISQQISSNIPQEKQTHLSTVTAVSSQSASSATVRVSQALIGQTPINIRQIAEQNLHQFLQPSSQQTTFQPMAQQTILQPTSQGTVLQPTIISGFSVQQQVLISEVSPTFYVSQPATSLFVPQAVTLQTSASVVPIFSSPQQAVSVSSVQGTISQSAKSLDVSLAKSQEKLGTSFTQSNVISPPLLRQERPSSSASPALSQRKAFSEGRQWGAALSSVPLISTVSSASTSVPQVRPFKMASPSLLQMITQGTTTPFVRGLSLPRVRPATTTQSVRPSSAQDSQFCKLPIPQMQLADFLAMQLRAQIEAANKIAENASSKSLNLPFMSNDEEIMAALNAPILKSIDSPLLAALNSTVIKALEGTVCMPDFQTSNTLIASSGEQKVSSPMTVIGSQPGLSASTSNKNEVTLGQTKQNSDVIATASSVEPEKPVSLTSPSLSSPATSLVSPLCTSPTTALVSSDIYIVESSEVLNTQTTTSNNKSPTESLDDFISEDVYLDEICGKFVKSSSGEACLTDCQEKKTNLDSSHASPKSSIQTLESPEGQEDVQNDEGGGKLTRIHLQEICCAEDPNTVIDKLDDSNGAKSELKHKSSDRHKISEIDEDDLNSQKTSSETSAVKVDLSDLRAEKRKSSEETSVSVSLAPVSLNHLEEKDVQNSKETLKEERKNEAILKNLEPLEPDLEDSSSRDSDSSAFCIALNKTEKMPSLATGSGNSPVNAAEDIVIEPLESKSDNCEENIAINKEEQECLSNIVSGVENCDNLSGSYEPSKSSEVICTVVSYSSLATSETLLDSKSDVDSPGNLTASSASNKVPSLRELLSKSAPVCSPTVVPSLINPERYPAPLLPPVVSLASNASSGASSITDSLSKSLPILSKPSLMSTGSQSWSLPSTPPPLLHLSNTDNSSLLTPAINCVTQGDSSLPSPTSSVQSVNSSASPGLDHLPIPPGFMAAPLDGAFRVTLPDATINKIIEDAIKSAGAALTPRAQEMVRNQLDRISNDIPSALKAEVFEDIANEMAASVVDNSIGNSINVKLNDGNLTSSKTRRKNDPFYKLPSTGLRPIRNVAEDGAVSWTCTLCGKSFTRNYTYRRHAESHTKAKPYKCDICSKAFTDRRYLGKHMRWHTGQDLQYCSLCGRAFSDELALTKHMRVHNTDKNFPCERCSKVFADGQSLKRHILHVHDQKKSHKCELCNLSFVFKSHLDDHMKRHTGEKPHKCSICGKGFIQVGTRNRHERQHKGGKDGEPYKCSICMNIFWFKDALRNHFHSMHPDIPVPEAHKKLFEEIDQAAQHEDVTEEETRIRVEHIPRERYPVTSGEENSSDLSSVLVHNTSTTVVEKDIPHPELVTVSQSVDPPLPTGFYTDALASNVHAFPPHSPEPIPVVEAKGQIQNLLAATVEPVLSKVGHSESRVTDSEELTTVDSKEHLGELVRQQEEMKEIARGWVESNSSEKSAENAGTRPNIEVSTLTHNPEADQGITEHHGQKQASFCAKVSNRSNEVNKNPPLSVRIKTEPVDYDESGPNTCNKEMETGNTVGEVRPYHDQVHKSSFKRKSSASSNAQGTLRVKLEPNTDLPKEVHLSSQESSALKKKSKLEDRTDRIASLMELFRQRGVPKTEVTSNSDDGTDSDSD